MSPAKKPSRVRAAFSTSPPLPLTRPCFHLLCLIFSTVIPTTLSWLLALYMGTCCFQSICAQLCFPLPDSERTSLSSCPFPRFPTTHRPYIGSTILAFRGEACGEKSQSNGRWSETDRNASERTSTVTSIENSVQSSPSLTGLYFSPG